MPENPANGLSRANSAGARSTDTATALGLSGDIAADLPRKGADAVDSAVALVHNKAIRPMLLVARGIVYGIVAGVLAAFFVVMVSIGVLRLLDVYAFPGRIWASYLLLGFIFTAAGLALWILRGSRQSRA